MSWKNTKLKPGEVRTFNSFVMYFFSLTCVTLKVLIILSVLVSYIELYLQDSFKPLVSISPNAR